MRRTAHFRINAAREELRVFKRMLSGRRRLCTLSEAHAAPQQSGMDEKEGSMDFSISLLLGNALMAIFLYFVIIVIWQD